MKVNEGKWNEGKGNEIRNGTVIVNLLDYFLTII